ncbi:MAG TPA: pyridoxamine 5'-phosphate oxidase family protein [Nitrososphaerales archaeon]|nr:pyridoxamine 5'-phosphate oxidase family protein [Nitrososphaerales archaeon]
MNPPVSTIDKRYSDPAAKAIEWDETRSHLEEAELFWISTVRADGRPHVTPVVAVWVDGSLYFSTGAEEQKFVNIRSNPNVVLTTGRNDWDRGIDVVVEGTATRISDEKLLARVSEAFKTKWDGRWRYAVRDGHFYNLGADNWQSEVFGVKPSRIFTHKKGDPFGATTHKF